MRLPVHVCLLACVCVCVCVYAHTYITMHLYLLGDSGGVVNSLDNA